MKPLNLITPADDLQQIINNVNRDTLWLSAGDFYIQDLVISEPINIRGAGPTFTRIHVNKAAQWGIRYDIPHARYLLLENLSIDMASSGIAVYFPYGLQEGTIQRLAIHGMGIGVGVQLCGSHPTAGPNNNQYQTLISQCDISNFGKGIYFQGQNADGCRPNANVVQMTTFSTNGLHIHLENGSGNAFNYNNFNPVVGKTDPRVLIDGYWCNNRFTGNYWDDVIDPATGINQLCVHQINSGIDTAYALIVEDNQPISRFIVDGKQNAIRYLGLYKN